MVGSNLDGANSQEGKRFCYRVDDDDSIEHRSRLSLVMTHRHISSCSVSGWCKFGAGSPEMCAHCRKLPFFFMFRM